MIIDVHTHVFPDAIAGKTLDFLKQKMLNQSGIRAESYTDGTVNGILDSMDKNSIDVSLIMPIATKVSQTTTINNFAESLRNDRLISFGSVHPLDADFENVLADLAERGFLGIKLHPEFQDFYIDSPEGLRLLKTAHKHGLFTLLHAGGDWGYPSPYHCTPERLKNILGEVDPTKIIAAHLGGFEMWDEVIKFIPKSGMYVDTAAVGNSIDVDVYKAVIKEIGAKNILFASDSPWEDQGHALSFLKGTGINDDEFDLITYKNACRLFGIKC